MRILMLTALLITGCGGGDDDDDVAVEDCSDCVDGEVCVAYLGTDDDHDECAAIPTECGGTADCMETDCISALYDLCENETMGVACSDTSPPTIVSCNP